MSISINTSNPNNIYAINCGTSTPKVGGSIDITSFPNLTSFACESNDITSFTASEPSPSLVNLSLSGNKLTDVINLPAFQNLTNYNVRYNALTGEVPDLDNNPNLKYFDAYSNKLTKINSLSGAINLVEFNVTLTACS